MPKSIPKSSPRSQKTIERVISKAGLGSRVEARQWIAAGRVKVNGKRVTDAECWIDPDRDQVTLDGRPVREGHKIYLLFYKPKGYLTTARDPQGRPTIYDLLKHQRASHPRGPPRPGYQRLLLLTNDTQFAERIANPEYKIAKTYLVKAASRLSEEDLNGCAAASS